MQLGLKRRNSMTTVIKRSIDLEKGDRVVFADLIEEVIMVEPGVGILKIFCRRHFKDRPPVDTFFFAGTGSVQEVEAKS